MKASRRWRFAAGALVVVSWYLMEAPPNPELAGGSYQCISSDNPDVTQYADYPKIDGAPLWRWNTVAVFDNEADCIGARDLQGQINLNDQVDHVRSR